MRTAKTVEQKALDLGEAKAVVDDLKAKMRSALSECPNSAMGEAEYQTGVSHLEEALNIARAYRDEHEEVYPEERLLADISSCPHCLTAYHAMEARKVAVRKLSNRKGTMLKAALKLFRDKGSRS